MTTKPYTCKRTQNGEKHNFFGLMDHHDISLEIVYFNSLTIVTVKVPVGLSFIDMVKIKSNFEMLKIFYPMNRFH